LSIGFLSKTKRIESTGHPHFCGSLVNNLHFLALVFILTYKNLRGEGLAYQARFNTAHFSKTMAEGTGVEPAHGFPHLP